MRNSEKLRAFRESPILLLNNRSYHYEGVRKVLFIWAFAAHTQLSLAFVH